MNSIIAEFNKGFGNCIFTSREPKNIEKTVMSRADKAFSNMPESIKVTPVDELHDKLVLILEDGSAVDGVLTWHKSLAGAHYVLTNLS